MTLEEIRKNVFEAVRNGEDPNEFIMDFYTAVEVNGIAVTCGEGYMALIPHAMMGNIQQMKSENIDDMSDSDLRKILKEYAAYVEKTDAKWKALVREASITGKKQELSRSLVEAVLKEQFPVNGIEIKSEDTTLSDDVKAVTGIVNLNESYWRSPIISIGVHINPSCPDYMQRLANVSAIPNKVGYSAPTQDEMRIDNMFDKCFNNWTAGDESYAAVSVKVLALANEMDYQAEPNTMQEIYDALTQAGITTEWIKSRYDYTKQDLQITSGDLVIIITRGKMPGMLVACSQFFQMVNICVSHKPLSQVVEWISSACNLLTPIADAIMPRINLLKEREEEMYAANKLMESLGELPHVTLDNGKYNFADVGYIEVNQSDDYLNIKYLSPLKTATALVELGKMMSEMAGNV